MGLKDAQTNLNAHIQAPWALPILPAAEIADQPAGLVLCTPSKDGDGDPGRRPSCHQP